jgi:hypothetical protein
MNYGQVINAKTLLVSAVAATLGATVTDSQARSQQCWVDFYHCKNSVTQDKSSCEEDARAQARAQEQERRDERDSCTKSTQECNDDYNQRKDEIIQQLGWEMEYCSNLQNAEEGRCLSQLEECS